MEEKLLARIELQPNGCWEWQRQIHPRGYAKWKVWGAKTGTQKSVWVHRLSYETFIGDIPEGLTIDHLCKNKSCINPDHLEAVSRKVNSERGNESYRQDNPKFPCGHLRSETGCTFPVYARSGALIQKIRCKPCIVAYQKNYQRKYKEQKYATADSLYKK